MDLNFDDISLSTCGFCHILVRSAEVDCYQQKNMRNGLENYDVGISKAHATYYDENKHKQVNSVNLYPPPKWLWSV